MSVFIRSTWYEVLLLSLPARVSVFVRSTKYEVRLLSLKLKEPPHPPEPFLQASSGRSSPPPEPPRAAAEPAPALRTRPRPCRAARSGRLHRSAARPGRSCEAPSSSADRSCSA